MSINKNQTISVIIPAFNAETDIKKCILSVLGQTCPVHEIIVINDGSTDKTAHLCSVIAEEQRQKSGIPVTIISVPNGGVARARNIGIQSAQGNFIAFLDSDDAWLPEKIAKQLAVFEQYQNAALVCSASTVHKKIKNKNRLQHIFFKDMLGKNCIITSSVLVNKNILPNPAFNEILKRSEDYNLWIKIAKNQSIYKINEELVVFAPKSAFGQQGLSKNIHAFEKDELKNFFFLRKEKYLSFFEFIFACTVSIIKYCRRIIITLLKRCM